MKYFSILGKNIDISIIFIWAKLFRFFFQEECPPPCTSTSFPMTLRKIHSNILISNNEELMGKMYAGLLFGYKTLQIDEEIETYIYDIGSFLTASGGNLGLFLGFSCLSMLLGLIDKILAWF
jgi:hypothetical protein